MAHRTCRPPFVFEHLSLRQNSKRTKIEHKATLLINNNRFQNKVKRMVHALRETSSDFNEISGNMGVNSVTQLSNSSNSIFLRVAWGLVLFGCITICLVQVHDRVSYYLSKPIVVDVKIEEQKNIVYPSITIASSDNAGAAVLIQKHNISTDIFICLNPIKILLEHITGLDTNLMWETININPSIIMAGLVTHHLVYKANRTEELGQHGKQVRLELDNSLPYDGMESKFMVKVKKQLHFCKGTFIMFVFLQRRSQICTDNETYLRCLKKCAVKKFSNYSCRFPFFPKEVNLPPCISGPEMGNLYKQTAAALSMLHCRCPRRCEETTYHISMRYVEENKNDTIINTYLVSNRVTIITERFAYHIITLMSDMGGTLGLCLGFSILSIFEVLQKLTSFVIKASRNERKNIPLHHADPIVRIVKRILSEELHQNCKIRSNTYPLTLVKITASPLWYLVLSIAVINLVICSCWFIHVRVSTYWSEPTHMTVQIVHKETVHFPNITICGLSTQIVFRLKGLSMMRNTFRRTSFNTLMGDWCSLQLIDLLDDPTVTADKLWKESSVFGEHVSSQDVGKIMLNRSLVENVSIREVDLPDGKCAEIHLGEQAFTGSETKYSRIFLSFAFVMLEKELIECDRHYQEIFVTPPGEIFHLNTRLVFPTGMGTSLIFESKQVTLWNTRRAPCMTHNLAKACHIRCFEAKLEKILRCRLPYMPSAFKYLPPCNSSRSGKQAHTAYMAEALNFDPEQYEECACAKSCHRTIISSSIFVEPHAFGKATLFSAFFFNNIYEHIVEVPVDSLTSVLCDIGGNLGITLGASLLSLFEILQSILLNFCRFCKHCCYSIIGDQISSKIGTLNKY